MPRSVMAAPPSAVTSPPQVAVVGVTLVLLRVGKVGLTGARGMKVPAVVTAVPSTLVAVRR